MMLYDFENFDEAMFHEIREHGKKYADSKSRRLYIEEHRKSVKAKKYLEYRSKPNTTAKDAEMAAYADSEYCALLEAIKAVVREEERHKWAMETFKIQFEHWRSMNARHRTENNNSNRGGFSGQ